MSKIHASVPSQTLSKFLDPSAQRPAPVGLLAHCSIVLFSIAYGLVLQALPVLQFKDRANYLNYAENSADILSRYVELGILPLLANEPVWLSINILLGTFLAPTEIMRAVIFVSASALSYLLLRADPRNAIWLALFMLSPQILKNSITHLRQGLGMAIFFAGYFGTGRTRRWSLMLLAPFVHASLLFILPLAVLPGIFRRLKFSVDTGLLIVAAFSLIVSLFMGLMASAIGARQATAYGFDVSTLPGLGLIFWLGILGLFILQGRTFLSRQQLAVGILLFYLFSYFFVEVTARIFESGLPIVLLAGLALTAWRKWVFIAAYLGYSTILWWLRLISATPF